MNPLARKLWRDLLLNRSQFVAVALTIFLGIAIFAASYDSFRNLETSYSTTFTHYRFANLTIAGGDSNQIAELVRRQAGVESASTRTVADLPLRVDRLKLLGRIVGVPDSDQPAVNRLEILEGSYVEPTRAHGVLLEEHMAEHFELSIGDTIEALVGNTWTDLEVVGIVSSPEYIWPARDRQELITSPDNFGVVFGSQTLATAVGGPSNEVAVYYADGTDDPALTARLVESAESLGAVSAYTRAEQPSNAALMEDIRGFEEIAVFFPLLFLSSAAMAAYVMISRLVYAQRPHIGALLANGMRRGRVLRHYLGYGLVPAALATVPGLATGMLGAKVITRLYTSMLSIPVTVIEFHPDTLIVGVTLGVAAAGLAALAPALLAVRVRPARAMRGETPPGRGRVSIVERVVPPVRRLPVRWKMILRGIERTPRRTIYTMLGVVLSLMLVLVSWGMLDTVNHLMELQFVEIERQDATVHFIDPVGIDDVEALERTTGVVSAEPVIEVPISITAGTRSYASLLVALPAGTQMHRFRGVDGAWTDLPADGLLVGKALGPTLGVGPGDGVDVSIGPLGTPTRVRVAGFVDEPLGTIAYMSRDGLAAALGSPVPATSAFIRFEQDAVGAEVRHAITELPTVAAFDDAQAMYETMQDYMGLFYLFVAVMLLFGSAMAFAVIFNTMSANIAERSREAATLLAVGAGQRAIGRLVAAENLLVTVAAIPLGLGVGYLAAREAMASFGSDLFSFDLTIQIQTYVWAGGAMLLVALLSQWPGLRAMRRLAIAQIIKERAA